MKKNLYQEVTDTIITLLSEHISEYWNKPWVALDNEGLPARNAFSGNTYKGLNQMLLSFTAFKKEYPKNQWMTFNQIRQKGGSILKGEKSTSIYFWKFLFLDENGKRLDASKYEKLSPEQLKVQGITKRPLLRYFNIFNIFQTTGLDEAFYKVEATKELEEFEKDERAENLINSTNANITYKAGNRAYYNPSSDSITLPLRKQFTGKEAFYETSLHELGHWTGHPSRLNRDLFNKFGSESYAREELVAELTTAFLCAELGFTKTITNNAAYIQSWISKLEDDNRFIFKAASQAEKASTFIKSFSKEVAAV